MASLDMTVLAATAESLMLAPETAEYRSTGRGASGTNNWGAWALYDEFTDTTTRDLWVNVTGWYFDLTDGGSFSPILASTSGSWRWWPRTAIMAEEGYPSIHYVDFDGGPFVDCDVYYKWVDSESEAQATIGHGHYPTNMSSGRLSEFVYPQVGKWLVIIPRMFGSRWPWSGSTGSVYKFARDPGGLINGWHYTAVGEPVMAEPFDSPSLDSDPHSAFYYSAAWVLISKKDTP